MAGGVLHAETAQSSLKLAISGLSSIILVVLGTANLQFLVMYGCESWTVKKAGHRRIDAFEL